MVSYAIVQASGKQFWVEEKRFYDLDKLPLNKGEVFKLNNILLINKNNSVQIGTPYLDKNFVIEAIVLRHVSGPKTRIYKMRSKKKTRKTFGNRPKLTRVLIDTIVNKTQVGSTCYLDDIPPG